MSSETGGRGREGAGPGEASPYWRPLLLLSSTGEASPYWRPASAPTPQSAPAAVPASTSAPLSALTFSRRPLPASAAGPASVLVGLAALPLPGDSGSEVEQGTAGPRGGGARPGAAGRAVCWAARERRREGWWDGAALPLLSSTTSSRSLSLTGSPFSCGSSRRKITTVVRTDNSRGSGPISPPPRHCRFKVISCEPMLLMARGHKDRTRPATSPTPRCWSSWTIGSSGYEEIRLPTAPGEIWELN